MTEDLFLMSAVELCVFGPACRPSISLMSHSSLSELLPSLRSATWWEGWWMASASAHSTSFHPYPSEKSSIQDRTQMETQIHLLTKSFSCLLPDSCLSYSLSFCCSCSFFSDFLSLCDLTRKMLFSSAQRTQEVGEGKNRKKDGEACKVWGTDTIFFFFFPNQPDTNPILWPPLHLCCIVGLNGVQQRQASCREPIVGR